MKRLAIALFALAPALGSCQDDTLPPRGQLLLYLDTDAPLALAPGETPSESIPFGLFDRLRVETLQADGTPACSACARDFSVDRGKLAKRALSVGIVTNGKSSLVVRVRLFRASAAASGEPRTSATIDRSFGVPAIAEEGIVEGTAFLPVEATGLGPSEAVEPLREGPPPAAPALHPAIRSARCTSEGNDGQVCVPGLAFWMSDPRIQAQSITGDSVPERLVVLSPFWIDDREITVGQLRAVGFPGPTEPVRFETDRRCNTTIGPGSREDLPVNCVSWATANRYCQARGARLPTEAEQEALLGAREGHRFVWGEDDPSCEDIVFARPDPETVGDEVFPTTCSALGIGAQRAGSGRRDVIELGGKRIFDMAGNVAEYAADVAAPLNASCRAESFVLDPVCTTGGSGRHVVRGTSWSLAAYGARSTTRLSDESFATFHYGFRCARSGR